MPPSILQFYIIRLICYEFKKLLSIYDIKNVYFSWFSVSCVPNYNIYFPHNFHRWLTLMLSQEFALPDVLRIWDSLLADETRSDFLIDVCTAMVLVIREDILTNDFADNVKLLQVKFYSFAITFSKKKLYHFFFVCKTGDPWRFWMM